MQSRLEIANSGSRGIRNINPGAWARVQAAAHNPRAHVALPLRTPLRALLRALAQRWTPQSEYKAETKCIDKGCDDAREEDGFGDDNEDREDLEEQLGLETDRVIVQELKQPRRLWLHVGPAPRASLQLPVLRPAEPLSSQKICFSSYLERMGSQRRDKDPASKIRTPKRQRKDSTTDKDKETEPKKIKIEEDSNKLMHIDETAIDGIELMASYKNILEDEEKPSTEDEKEVKSEETPDDEIDAHELKDLTDRDKDLFEREKDSFSEMEDDEKYNKSDTDNESDQGKNEKGKQTKFKNLKVKFRIRPKKRGGSMYTLVIEKDQEDAKADEAKADDAKADEGKVDEGKADDGKADEGKADEGKADYGKADEGKADDGAKAEEPKPDIDVDLAIRQIRRGWSEMDAGELTIGDLYLMFGSRSKLELDYWWAEPTPPLPQPPQRHRPDPVALDRKDKPEKVDKGGGDSSVEEGARESDADMLSPRHAYSHDSNDALSGDERKGEQLASPEHKSSASCSGTLKLVSKLVNRPQPPSPTQHQTGFSALSERLKRLLALAGNPHAAAARCACAPLALPPRRALQKPVAGPTGPAGAASVGAAESRAAPLFRHPTPIAPRPTPDPAKAMSLEGMPKWRRGRPRLADRRVVVQRLLPLLPKLPPPSNLIPVKIVPNSPPAPPRILPKPPPTSTSDLSMFYVLSESNGQFYFHDGDRRIPITPLPAQPDAYVSEEEDVKQEAAVSDSAVPDATVSDVAVSDAAVSDATGSETGGTRDGEGAKAGEPADIANFLPSESLSLSPSRLLRDADGWLEGSVQDFSLSSFLGHLEGRPQPSLAVDSQLQSLMAESSVDYVAKFADLAAEVTDEVNLDDDLT